MKNILNIIGHDLKKVTGSVVAIVTIIGLCLVPCSYAWFNILSNWAPYESEATGRIAVAVANEDKGASVAGIGINVGEKIVTALEANNDIGWVFVEDADQAKAGVLASDYYAALVIPESFTEDVLSFVDGDLTNPKLLYYENEKKNAIAPKITGKAKTAVQEEVNATFVETIAGYVSDAASAANATGIDPAAALADLAERIESLGGDLDSCIALSNSAAGLTSSAANLLKVSGALVDQTQSVISANDKVLAEAEKKLSEEKKTDTTAIKNALSETKTINSSLKTMRTAVSALAEGSQLSFDLFLDTSRDKWVKEAEKLQADAKSQGDFVTKQGFTALGSEFYQLSDKHGEIADDLRALNKEMTPEQRKDAVAKLVADIDEAIELTETIEKQIKDDIDTNLETALGNTRSSIASFRKSMSTASSDLSKLNSSLSSYDASMAKLKKGFADTSAKLAALQGDAGAAAALLNDASGNQLLQLLTNLLGNDEAAVAEYLANPISMDTKVIWPAENYGSAMAPFYTVLAQWVGALLTAVLIKVKVRKRDDLTNLRLHEWYFGRYGLYLMVGLAQALVVAAGDLLYVHIQCESPLLFVLECCVNGIVFMMINYALVFALDNIGLGAAVIILVLQVAGSGGTYPVEVLPGEFQVIYPFMPFRYAMTAMRECICGMYGNVFWHSLGVLGLFFVFAVAFGLAFYKPMRWLNDMIAASKAKSEIML